MIKRALCYLLGHDWRQSLFVRGPFFFARVAAVTNPPLDS
jgi:hypothetical protein